MKTVLAFGDSLTFGTNAATSLRHAYEDRWPSALEAGLAGQARVIAEGLGGRTTMFDDFSTAADRNGARHAYENRWPAALEAGLLGQARVIAEGLGGRTTSSDDFTADADRNGARILPTLLASHAPLDLVIIMLGTNDLKPAIFGSALMASYGMRRLVQLTRGHFQMLDEPVPGIIIVAPPLVIDSENADMLGHFGGLEHAAKESAEFAYHYARRAAELGTGFFDAATVAAADPLDGVHLNAANTRAIGEGLVPVVKSMLGF